MFPGLNDLEREKKRKKNNTFERECLVAKRLKTTTCYYYSWYFGCFFFVALVSFFCFCLWVTIFIIIITDRGGKFQTAGEREITKKKKGGGVLNKCH